MQKDFYKTKRLFKVGDRITRGVTATPILQMQDLTVMLGFFYFKKNNKMEVVSSRMARLPPPILQMQDLPLLIDESLFFKILQKVSFDNIIIGESLIWSIEMPINFIFFKIKLYFNTKIIF